MQYLQNTANTNSNLWDHQGIIYRQSAPAAATNLQNKQMFFGGLRLWVLEKAQKSPLSPLLNKYFGEKRKSPLNT
jgi:hypothetical protein